MLCELSDLEHSGLLWEFDWWKDIKLLVLDPELVNEVVKCYSVWINELNLRESKIYFVALSEFLDGLSIIFLISVSNFSFGYCLRCACSNRFGSKNL